ncbi:MAG: D-Ala-D-Ala carboxypeptidase family metallohydrolase [Pseudomonadota bacterium]
MPRANPIIPPPGQSRVEQWLDQPIVRDWSAYAEFFGPDEFACSATGVCEMQVRFLDLLLQIRRSYGRPMRITSGYRHPTHPIEAAKGGLSRGEHTMGACCDVAAEGDAALILMQYALAAGITRLGVNQKGTGRFLHLGVGGPGLANPWVWSY